MLRPRPTLLAKLLAATVRGPGGEPIPATVLVVDATAYVESAQACGLHLTGGVEWSRWRFSAGDSLTRDFSVTGDNGVATDVTAAGVGRFELNATSTVVPLEATTSVRILYLASLYVGGGVDFQVGSADADIAVSGQMTGVRPSGTATVTARGDGRPSRVAYHLLLGAEANLWRVKLVVQGSFVPFDGATVGLGLRVRL